MSTSQSLSSPLLEVRDLCVQFRREGAFTEVVSDVDLQVRAGERVALVGESGSGKSVTALSVLQLHERASTRYRGGIAFAGQALLDADERDLQRLRGKEIAMIFQEPMTALNPLYTIGEQLTEPLRVHAGMTRTQARTRMLDLLDRTGIRDPEARFDAYPHMLSGGQRQRAMIAMALACNPKLLIADEPTTALDVTIQAQILELLEDIQREFGMAVLLITHDLNIVRRFAERIYVMQSGRVVETAPVAELFAQPTHAYTRKLLDSQPERLNAAVPTPTPDAPPLLQARAVRCYFPIKAGFFRRQVGEVKAVDNVALTLAAGETLGVVGESGSGKSTLGMCLLRLQACSGDIVFDGRPLQHLRERALRPLRRDFQVVFQDPYSSLSPRMSVAEIVGEGLRIHFPALARAERERRIVAAMTEVGLEPDMLSRFPHEFSGGQRQRIAIARAIILEPKLLLLDEPTSALDVSVQKQVLELLADLQRRRAMSYLFITHDLKVIRAMAHRLIVMRNGVVVETGTTEELFTAPTHAYTQALLQASLLRRHPATDEVES